MPAAITNTSARIVILTGAGASAESGLQTFRDSEGLWEGHDPMEIATPEAFARNPERVYRFYNARRAQLEQVQPNSAHREIARLQDAYPGDVFLVTQNVDNLHERGGSAQVCHMHGELGRMLCLNCRARLPAPQAFDAQTVCPKCMAPGGLRPDIVWFGEVPYNMPSIGSKLAACDLFIAIGTSGVVYPAAGFVQEARAHGAYAIEINKAHSDLAPAFHEHRVGNATEQVALLVEELLSGASF
jgi:NAD-dependent deacetylase